MVQDRQSRRAFTLGAASIGTIALAGCMSEDDSGSGANTDIDLSDYDFEDREQYLLTLEFENEDGEPVSSGIEGTATPEDGSLATYNISSTAIQEGVLQEELPASDYTIVVSSTDDEFDDVETDVVLDQDVEEQLTLDGAAADE